MTKTLTMKKEEEHEEEAPIKLVELNDFLRLPSILSPRLSFQSSSLKNSSDENSDPSSSLINTLLQSELIVPKEMIFFVDETDRKKLSLFKKSTNVFSRHLLITSGAALQALIPSLTNAEQWIILCKLKYSKRYRRHFSTQGDVLLSLNIHHPLIRYEILNAFDLLQQSFHQIRTSSITMDFASLLVRWFKMYLRRTDQYPSLTHRVLYRYQIEKCKYSITLGKRNADLDKSSNHLGQTIQKILNKSDSPLDILVDFNSVPALVYSIQLNNLFIYSLNEDHQDILRDMGHGFSLVSVQDLNLVQEKYYSIDHQEQPLMTKTTPTTMKKEKDQIPIDSIPEDQRPIELTEEEKYLFDKLSQNQQRIQLQHQHLLIKAAKFLSNPLIEHKELFS